MVRGFTNCPGDLNSIPGRVIQKTQKMIIYICWMYVSCIFSTLLIFVHYDIKIIIQNYLHIYWCTIYNLTVNNAIVEWIYIASAWSTKLCLVWHSGLNLFAHYDIKIIIQNYLHIYWCTIYNLTVNNAIVEWIYIASAWSTKLCLVWHSGLNLFTVPAVTRW